MASYAIVFHGDADGICAAALFANFLSRRGHSYELFSPRNVDISEIVQELGPFDKVVVLDISKLSYISKPVIWVDHHRPFSDVPKNFLYINPRLYGKNLPTSYVIWRLVGGPSWIAYLGSVSDGFIPPKMHLEYPKSLVRGLIPIVNSARFGNLQIEAVKAILNGPRELLDKRFINTWRSTEVFVHRAVQKAWREGLIAVAEFSSPGYISNYVASKLRRYGIGVAANHIGNMVEVEARTLLPIDLRNIFEKYGGGGHERAAGAVVSEDEWKQLKKELIKASKDILKPKSDKVDEPHQ